MVAAHALSCPVARGIPEQGLNLHHLHSATTDVCKSRAHALQQEKHPLCYQSKLALLAPPQANESEKLGIEARKRLYLGIQLMKRMAAEHLKITILLESGCQVLL